MPESRAWAITKVAVVAAVSLAGFFIYLPLWLGLLHLTVDFHGWRALRLLALGPLLAGAMVGLRCVFDFAWTGRGTPAPIDPPRRLVVRGFYAHVRNPMYLGFGLAIFGAWVVFGGPRWPALIGAAVVVAGVDLFVRFYEEPTLRHKFGADYEQYCRNVPRWWPRLRPWIPERAGAAQAG